MLLVLLGNNAAPGSIVGADSLLGMKDKFGSLSGGFLEYSVFNFDVCKGLTEYLGGGSMELLVSSRGMRVAFNFGY